jgi:hypothetical protein
MLIIQVSITGLYGCPLHQGYWEPYNMKRVNASGIEFNTGFNGKIALV